MSGLFNDFKITIDTKINDEINQSIKKYQGDNIHPWRSRNLVIEKCSDLYYFIGYFLYKLCYDINQAQINQEFVKQFKERILEYKQYSSNQEFYNKIIQFVMEIFDVTQCSIPSSKQYINFAQKTKLSISILDYAFKNMPRILKFKNGLQQIDLKQGTQFQDNSTKTDFCLIYFIHNEVPNLVITSVIQEPLSKIKLISQCCSKTNKIQIQCQQQIIKPQVKIIQLISQTQQGQQQLLERSSQSIMDTMYDISQVKSISPQIQSNYKMKTNVLEQCQICGEQFQGSQQGFLLNCKCLIHKECLQMNCMALAEEFREFEKIVCPYCCKQMDIEDIKQLLNFDMIQKIIIKQVDRIVNLQCYNCQTPIILSEKGKQQQIEVQCSKCKSLICSQCKQKYHGQNQNGNVCPSQKAGIIEAMKKSNFPIIICPICDNISTKDDKCDHVQCSKCQTDLCAACSCIRSPSIEHGNQYHRKGCKHYHEWIDQKTKKIQKDTYQAKCTQCKAKGSLCDKPISLDEYKKLKQF